MMQCKMEKNSMTSRRVEQSRAEQREKWNTVSRIE